VIFLNRMFIFLLAMGLLFALALSIQIFFAAEDLKAQASDPNTTVSANMPWNWTGIVGTGQSLSVGANANPAETDNQPYHNLKLSLGSFTGPPWDPDNSTLSMIPLVEPIRNYAYGYPSAYPRNIYGETPHSAMANQITKLALSGFGMDYVTVHTVVGESGQGMSVIRKGATDKGTTGRAYAASLFEVQAIKRLAAAAGKTYGVSAVVITHGETDAGNTNYETDLHQMWSDYNKDLREITGQSQEILMFTNQQHSCPKDSGTSASTLAQWKSGVDYPEDIICTGPKYQYFYSSDGIHLSTAGYQQLGEKIGEVYYEKVVLGHDWRPLQPTSVVRTRDKVITVNFHVPVPPLSWDKTMPAPNQSSLTEWKKGKGFEVYTAGGKRITIRSVAISGSSIVITCASPLPTSGVKVGYAFTTGGDMRPFGTFRWGLLRDSDPFKGGTTGVSQPNFCVAFEMDVP
jgi:lysophospholipase L1-like esterase